MRSFLFSVYLININACSARSIPHHLPVNRIQLPVNTRRGLPMKYLRLANLGSKSEVYQSVLDRNIDLERENDRIQRLNTTLQSRIHEITLRVGRRTNPSHRWTTISFFLSVL